MVVSETTDTPMKRLLLAAFLLPALALLPSLAAAKVEPQTEDETPILPKKKEQVTIVQDKDQLIEIHQIDGRVYGLKVIPKKGKPYFLVDLKGDGNFIQNASDRLLVPEWVILSW